MTDLTKDKFIALVRKQADACRTFIEILRYLSDAAKRERWTLVSPISVIEDMNIETNAFDNKAELSVTALPFTIIVYDDACFFGHNDSEMLRIPVSRLTVRYGDNDDGSPDSMKYRPDDYKKFCERCQKKIKELEGFISDLNDTDSEGIPRIVGLVLNKMKD